MYCLLYKMYDTQIVCNSHNLRLYEKIASYLNNVLNKRESKF